MPKALVKDIIGPLPCSTGNTCYIVIESENRMIPIPCSILDGEICHALVYGGITPENGYEFLNSVLSKLDVKVESVEIDVVNDMVYGRILFSSKLAKKPIKITTGNPGAVINFALVSELPISMSASVIKKANDATIEYHRLKACMPLWPLPAVIDKTEALHLLSDFVDKAFQYDA
jgi:bifunctional DNase/RNase